MVTVTERATRTVYDYFRDAPPPEGLVLHAESAACSLYLGWCVEGAQEKPRWWPWARHDWVATIPDHGQNVTIEVRKPGYLDAITSWAERLEQAMGIAVKIVVLRDAYPATVGGQEWRRRPFR